MCFSATTSFTSAALTGVIGLASIRLSRSKRELPYAATPLIFAVQQAIEGFVWLDVFPVDNPGWSGSIGLFYLVIAGIFWPLYAPTMAFLIEPQQWRCCSMLVSLAIGLGVAGYVATMIATESVSISAACGTSPTQRA